MDPAAVAPPALERAREATQAPPPVDTPLSERARLLDVVVQAHALADIMGGYTDARCAAIDGTTEEGKRADILRD